MKADRVVIDTNVLISAALSPKGKPFACLQWCDGMQFSFPRKK
jgi:predicted nucleic acid-binding protein